MNNSAAPSFQTPPKPPPPKIFQPKFVIGRIKLYSYILNFTFLITKIWIKVKKHIKNDVSFTRAHAHTHVNYALRHDPRATFVCLDHALGAIDVQPEHESDTRIVHSNHYFSHIMYF